MAIKLFEKPWEPWDICSAVKFYLLDKKKENQLNKIKSQEYDIYFFLCIRSL